MLAFEADCLHAGDVVRRPNGRTGVVMPRPTWAAREYVAIEWTNGLQLDLVHRTELDGVALVTGSPRTMFDLRNAAATPHLTEGQANTVTARAARLAPDARRGTL